ncbi:MAG: hypothetical protein HC897_16940 [Thermoanaerobaculia bacterium]|nr:hypothetical protein [Thermoanaerobaculia bacterium]
MRRRPLGPALSLLLLLASWLAAAPRVGATPTLTLDVPPSFSGTPLRFEVEMGDWTGGPVRVEVFSTRETSAAKL